MLHSIYQEIWKTQQWPQDYKRSIFIPGTKKGNAKKCSNSCTIALISHAIKVMFKILQARLQQYVNWELSCTHWIYKGQKNQRSNCQHSLEHRKSKEFQKNVYFCFIDSTKAFMWITINCGKLLRWWAFQTTLPASWETCMQVKK